MRLCPIQNCRFDSLEHRKCYHCTNYVHHTCTGAEDLLQDNENNVFFSNEFKQKGVKVQYIDEFNEEEKETMDSPKANNKETFWDVSTKAVSAAVFVVDFFVRIYIICTIYNDNVFMSVSFLYNLCIDNVCSPSCTVRFRLHEFSLLCFTFLT